jgi:hypothetical protein
MVNDIQPGLVRKKCRFCGTTFWASRSDAQFCTKSHRQMFSRWRKRLALVATRSQIDLQNVASYLDFPDSRDTALANLVELRQKIKELVRERGIILKEIR